MIHAVSNFSNYSYQTAKAKNNNQSVPKEAQYVNNSNNLSFASKKIGLFDAIRNVFSNSFVKTTPSTKLPSVDLEASQKAVNTFVNKASLGDVQIKKGVCTYPNGKPFSGEVKGTLKGGDDISLVYEKGVLQSSERSGSKNFAKEYSIRNGKMYKVENSGIYDISSGETRFTYRPNGKLSSLGTPDGTLKIFHENGKIASELFVDGTTKRYDETTGKLVMEEFHDGTKKYYNEAGGLRRKVLPCGTEKFYDKDGEIIKETKQMRHEHLDKPRLSYGKDGRLTGIEFPDGSSRTYYANGNLLNEITADGIIKRYDKKTNNLTMIEFPDGVKEFYNEAGKLTDIYTDASEKHFDNKGRVTYEITEKRVTKHYNMNGNLRDEIYPDGTEIHYDVDGNMVYKKLADGTKIDANKND